MSAVLNSRVSRVSLVVILIAVAVMVLAGRPGGLGGLLGLLGLGGPSGSLTGTMKAAPLCTAGLTDGTSSCLISITARNSGDAPANLSGTLYASADGKVYTVDPLDQFGTTTVDTALNPGESRDLMVSFTVPSGAQIHEVFVADSPDDGAASLVVPLDVTAMPGPTDASPAGARNGSGGSTPAVTPTDATATGAAAAPPAPPDSATPSQTPGPELPARTASGTWALAGTTSSGWTQVHLDLSDCPHCTVSPGNVRLVDWTDPTMPWTWIDNATLSIPTDLTAGMYFTVVSNDPQQCPHGCAGGGTTSLVVLSPGTGTAGRTVSAAQEAADARGSVCWAGTSAPTSPSPCMDDCSPPRPERSRRATTRGCGPGSARR